MYKLTDLFCLTIIFAKFNILASFIVHFLANIDGYTQQDLPMQHGHSVSPHKNGQKLFIADGGQIVLGKFIGGLFNMEGQ